MSVNDAKDSSEVNRGESNISVASNIDANFAMQQQNNATISAPENTSMIEHKTTSISDITDPTKRREMDRETRRNARKTRRESRRAERKERHRLRKLAGALFGGKKKIVWISLAVVSVVCAGYFAVRNYVIIPAWLAKEDAAYEEYISKYNNEVLGLKASVIESIEYKTKTQEEALDGMAEIISSESNDDKRFMLEITYINILTMYRKFDDAEEELKKIEKTIKYLYQKEAYYLECSWLDGSRGDMRSQDAWLKKARSLERNYIQKENENA